MSELDQMSVREYSNNMARRQPNKLSQDSFAGRTPFFAVVKDGYSRIAMPGTHFLDANLSHIFKQIVVDAISRSSKHKPLHLRFDPPLVRQFNVQSVMRQFHRS